MNPALLFAILLLSSAASAGAIQGTVTFRGVPPAAARLTVERDQRACGTSQPDESMLVDARGGLRNAVVYLEGAPAAPAPPALPDAVLDQVRCQYLPHVQAVRVGTRLVVVNSDSTLHTVRAMRQGQTLFNRAMPLSGMRTTVPLSVPGLIRTGCDAGHTWMSAWIYAFDHPYFAVTGPEGAFEIPNVPPGTYSLVAWHETLGNRTQKVRVPAEKPLTIAFSR